MKERLKPVMAEMYIRARGWTRGIMHSGKITNFIICRQTLTLLAVCTPKYQTSIIHFW